MNEKQLCALLTALLVAPHLDLTPVEDEAMSDKLLRDRRNKKRIDEAYDIAKELVPYE